MLPSLRIQKPLTPLVRSLDSLISKNASANPMAWFWVKCCKATIFRVIYKFMKYRQSITYYLPIWCCRYCLTVTVLPQIWHAYPTFSCILLMCSLSGVGPKKALSHWSHWKFLIPSWMFAKKIKSQISIYRYRWGNIEGTNFPFIPIFCF